MSCVPIRAGGGLVVAVLCGAVAMVNAQEPVRPAPRMALFSPDGNRLAVVTGELEEKGALTVWDAATLRLLWAYGEPRGIPSVAFAPDGKMLAIGSLTAEAKVFDTVKGQQRATYGGHGKAARAVGFAPDGKLLAVGTYEGFIKLWDVVRGTEVRTMRGHTDRIYSVVFSADGTRLLSAGIDAARLWDLDTGQEQHVLRHGGSLVHAAIFSPDGRSVLTGGWDGTVRLWDAQTGKPHWRLETRVGVDGLAFCPSRDLLAICGTGRRIGFVSPVFRPCDEHQRRRLEALLVQLDDDSYAVRETASHDISQMGLIVEPMLHRAMTAATSAEVRLRCRRLRRQLLTKPQAELTGHTEGVESVAFSPAGNLLVSASHDGTVRLWDVAARTERGRLVPSEPTGQPLNGPSGGEVEGNPGR